MRVSVMRSGVFSVVCRKCTREARYSGNTPGAAADKAKAAGWTMPAPNVFVYPNHPKSTPNAVKREEHPCRTTPPS